MRSRCSKDGGKVNSEGFTATRNALGGIENVMRRQTPQKRRLSEVVGERWPLSAVKPSKSSKAPVPDISPIEGGAAPVARSRKRVEGATPARLVTSTPANPRPAKQLGGSCTPAPVGVTSTPVGNQPRPAKKTAGNGSTEVVMSTPARLQPRQADRLEDEENTAARVATSTPASSQHRLPTTLNGDASGEIVTSTPASVQSLPRQPDASLGEALSHTSVDPGYTSNPSPCLFDSALASPEKSQLRPRRRASPELSVRHVSRTYSRTSKSPRPVRVHLFTAPAESSSEDEEAGGLRKKPTGTKRQAKKTVGTKKGKQEKADAAFEEWAKNMTAEFEKIEEYELCIV
ncbi:uncharacterized protein LOC144149649 [Haemaphysalis longicornis]